MTSQASLSPLAITMWDFSWLERRWPGAGYEDWDRALDELLERGYDAVRIDAYPHLVVSDPDATFSLLPCWDQHDWGAPGVVEVQVFPALIQFISKCADRGIRVALSSWFRQDTREMRLLFRSARDFGDIWSRVLDRINQAGLLGSILYVDLCNEFPLRAWAPFLYLGREERIWSRTDAELTSWMAEAIAVPRERYPELKYTFSFCNELSNWKDQDVTALDLLELHLWMASNEVSDFHERTHYALEQCRFDPVQFANLVERGEPVYRADPAYWLGLLDDAIERAAEWSRRVEKPLVTTESWSVINYKDFPMASWGWLKEICEHGVRRAAAAGRWNSQCTSNFCGPQFVGMWRDVDWHQRMTTVIHAGQLDDSALL